MLSKEETKHIADLARLGLDSAEIEKYQKDLSAILGYVDKLKEANVDGIEPMAHPGDAANVLRQDQAMPRAPEKSEKLRAAFPEAKNGHLKVKAIL